MKPIGAKQRFQEGAEARALRLVSAQRADLDEPEEEGLRQVFGVVVGLGPSDAKVVVDGLLADALGKEIEVLLLHLTVSRGRGVLGQDVANELPPVSCDNCPSVACGMDPAL